MKAKSTSSDSPKTVNVHDAKTHLSQLILEASQDSLFIIAKVGKPMVKVASISNEANSCTGMLVLVGDSAPDSINDRYYRHLARETSAKHPCLTMCSTSLGVDLSYD